MRRLLLLVVIAIAAISSGCNTSNDPGPYYYNDGYYNGYNNGYNNGYYYGY